jgi:hypothetical protein
MRFISLLVTCLNAKKSRMPNFVARWTDRCFRFGLRWTTVLPHPGLNFKINPRPSLKSYLSNEIFTFSQLFWIFIIYFFIVPLKRWERLVCSHGRTMASSIVSPNSRPKTRDISIKCNFHSFKSFSQFQGFNLQFMFYFIPHSKKNIFETNFSLIIYVQL